MKLQNLFTYMLHFHYNGLVFPLIMKLLLFIVTSTVTVVINLSSPFVSSNYLRFNPRLSANETQRERGNKYLFILFKPTYVLFLKYIHI